MPQHDEHVQNPKGDGRHGEEVAGGDVGNVIIQEGSPGWRRWFSWPDHVLGYGVLGDFVTEQQQFGQDSGRAPGWILAGHPANQVTDLMFDGRASGFSGPRLPSPEQLEAFPVPLDDGFGLDDGQGRSPVRPEAGKHDPEDAVAWPQLGTLGGLLENGNLLSECKVLERCGSTAKNEGHEE